MPGIKALLPTALLAILLSASAGMAQSRQEMISGGTCRINGVPTQNTPYSYDGFTFAGGGEVACYFGIPSGYESSQLQGVLLAAGTSSQVAPVRARICAHDWLNIRSNCGPETHIHPQGIVWVVPMQPLTGNPFLKVSFPPNVFSWIGSYVTYYYK